MEYVYPFSNTDDRTKLAVWEKGIKLRNYAPSVWRRDVFGGLMRYSDYGNTSTETGWEIAHIMPAGEGGTDDLSNLQPLQWRNSRTRDEEEWQPDDLTRMLG